MKPLGLAFGLLFLSTCAHAQQQPQFIPFTVDERLYQGIMTALGEVPAKYANLIIGVLIQAEQEAQRRAAIENEKRVPEKQ